MTSSVPLRTGRSATALLPFSRPHPSSSLSSLRPLPLSLCAAPQPRSSARRASASDQIDQDAILAQMLQDEMFMADIRANPELYYPDEAPQPQPTGHPATSQPSSSVSSPSHAVSSHSGYAHSHAGGRGDFSGLGGGGSTGSGHPSASFRDKFNSLTSAAKKRLLTVATKLKAEGPSPAAKKEYNVERQDLASGLLSDDAGSEEVSVLGSGGRRSSERVTERDVEPVALSARVEDGPVDDGVYTQEEGEGGNGTGYVPPSMVGDLNVSGKKRIWGRKTSSSDDA